MRPLMAIKLSAAMAVAVAVTTPGTAAASEFRLVTDRDEFVSIVDGRQLTRFGIRLQVDTAGDISGRGFGHDVWGQWQWDGRFFCRDLGYGNTDLGHNCQAVAVRGDTIRFVADQGQGDYADFRLR